MTVGSQDLMTEINGSKLASSPRRTLSLYQHKEGLTLSGQTASGFPPIRSSTPKMDLLGYPMTLTVYLVVTMTLQLLLLTS